MTQVGLMHDIVVTGLIGAFEAVKYNYKDEIRINSRLCSGLIYVAVGSSSYRLRDGRVLDVSDGNIFLLSRGEGYNYNIFTPEYRAWYFDFQTDEESVSPSRAFPIKSDSAYRPLFQKAVNLWSGKTPSSPLYCRALLYELLAMLTDAERAYTPGSRMQKLKPALDYISQNYKRSALTVPEVSRSTGISEGYLRRLFAELYNMPPTEYINQLRLSYASDLLRCGEYSVGAVAEAAGFNSLYYFSGFFKRRTGLSPVDYMARCAGMPGCGALR